MSNNSLSKILSNEFDDIKEDLINSIEVNSVPISPLQALFEDQFNLVSKSAPPSPRFKIPLGSVRNLVSDFENIIPVAQTFKMAKSDDIKADAANLKRVCTRFLNQLKAAEQDGSLDATLLSVLKPKIVTRVSQLENKEMELDAVLNKLGIFDSEQADRKYCEGLITYITETEKELSRICKIVNKLPGGAEGEQSQLLNSITDRK